MEKWDWDKLVGYCPKNMQFAEWMIGDDGENQGSGHASSAKSSISDSSTKDPIEANKLEIKACTTSAEALLGLKLGKRTYFENNAVKKPKSSAQNTPLCCQVEGCNIDLSTAKEYHRKHRVCESHSKCPRVVVAGRERRFCQQCSRFHSLSEFDEKKRSCRRRLSDHNARRRKPQQETIRFDSTRHSTTLPFYGGNQEMNFVLNNSPVRNSGWDSACNSKFTLTQGYSLKSNGDEELRMMNMQNGVLASSSSMVSNPATEHRRALSLLSSNSWDHQQIHGSDFCIMQPMIPEVAPLELWASGQQDPTNSNSFQEIQLFKTPFDANFYSNILN